MNKKIEDKLRAILSAPPQPPLEATRQFLERYAMDVGSFDEVEDSIARMALNNPRTLYQGLAGIEGVLAGFPKDIDIVRNIIACETGWVLRNNSDEGVREWLKILVEILRRHINPPAAEQ
jgi:hypothetical protein